MARLRAERDGGGRCSAARSAPAEANHHCGAAMHAYQAAELVHQNLFCCAGSLPGTLGWLLVRLAQRDLRHERKLRSRHHVGRSRRRGAPDPDAAHFRNLFQRPVANAVMRGLVGW